MRTKTLLERGAWYAVFAPSEAKGTDLWGEMTPGELPKRANVPQIPYLAEILQVEESYLR